MFRFAYGGAQSHVGLVRQNNEDSGFAGPYLQLVADGVGGAAAGEVASATTAYVVSAMAATRTGDLVELLTAAVQASYRQLRLGVVQDPGRAGMATTLTGVAVDRNRFALVHVGDSRAYLLRGGRLTRLTRDHTLVQALVGEGRLPREEVASHPYRSMVLKSIDGERAPEPDVSWLDLEPGDRLLVCSDGLTDLVAEDRIGELLQVRDAETASRDLVTAALERGGRDNVTCLVTDVEDGREVCSDGRLLGALSDPYLVVDPAAVRLGCTA